MKTKKILYLFLLPLIFTACETKDIPVYTSDDAALYFQRTASYICCLLYTSDAADE